MGESELSYLMDMKLAIEEAIRFRDPDCIFSPEFDSAFPGHYRALSDFHGRCNILWISFYLPSSTSNICGIQ